ncbi:hypothetical protein OHA_1_00992 [Pleomorphomonas sp. SM30]|uniref:Uncharacterized protein n=2 Tax=Oharaeibacter diazotrophicus TaxID=1920512 RepID=A0A4R6RJ53_9HYPH|nr:hypothetical protein EDD54_0520 [Oharaeibacter diazotrophicus]BBE71418.1 hypothetical protein OHA_1_00992 [Pleomorphomonas sp. SM30]
MVFSKPAKKGADMSLFQEDEDTDLLPAPASDRGSLRPRASMALVTMACAVSIGFALVGAAYAVDRAPAGDVVEKGDLIAADRASAPTLTLEDANLDAGFSNLYALPARN